MIATKEQEREALKKIRKIVEGLGEGSYLSFAFEGCFEKAEENIENDMACSYKQVADSLEETVNAQQKEIANIKKTKEALTVDNGKLIAENVALKEKYNKMKSVLLNLITCSTLYLNDLNEKVDETSRKFSESETLTKESLDEFYKKQSVLLDHLDYTKKALEKAQEVYNEANC